jgi:hypothetical protein
MSSIDIFHRLHLLFDVGLLLTKYPELGDEFSKLLGAVASPTVANQVLLDAVNGAKQIKDADGLLDYKTPTNQIRLGNNMRIFLDSHSDKLRQIAEQAIQDYSISVPKFEGDINTPLSTHQTPPSPRPSPRLSPRHFRLHDDIKTRERGETPPLESRSFRKLPPLSSATTTSYLEERVNHIEDYLTRL